MRHIFTYTIPTTNHTEGGYDAGTYQIAYLGYPQKNPNTGYQTAEEMLTHQKKTAGLLEILYLSDPQSGTRPTPSTKVPTTFGHLGFIVPDIIATEARMCEHDVPVLNGVEEPLDFGNEKGGEVACAFGLGSGVVRGRAEAMAVLQGISGLGFGRFLLVKDPDGNLVEIQEQS